MDSQQEGFNHYMECGEYDRAWFTRQWQIWPERSDTRYTTNLSFHYGGILAFRAENQIDPIMSKSLKNHVKWLDRNSFCPIK